MATALEFKESGYIRWKAPSGLREVATDSHVWLHNWTAVCAHKEAKQRPQVHDHQNQPTKTADLQPNTCNIMISSSQESVSCFL